MRRVALVLGAPCDTTAIQLLDLGGDGTTYYVVDESSVEQAFGSR